MTRPKKARQQKAPHVAYEIRGEYASHEAQRWLGDILSRVRYRRDRVLVTQYGAPAAVLINPEELKELEARAAKHRTGERASRPAGD